MRKAPDKCYECVFGRMRKFADKFIPQDKRQRYIDEATEAVFASDPDELEVAWEMVAKKYLKTDDVHRKDKEAFQKCIMDMKDDIENLLDKSEEGLLDAIRFAIAGNVIDFATINNLDFEFVKKVISQVKETKLDEKLWNHFIEDLSNAKKAVILLDNVGEVVFDTILLKKIKEKYPDIEITAIPSSYPISSDTTLKECYESGMADYATLIPNGNGVTGTYLPKCSKEAIEAMEEADIIISKGMANFETMAGSDYNIYYFFMCKCELYCEIIGVNRFDEVFLSDRYSDTKKCKKENWSKIGVF